jgi:hypothetical protein
MVIDDKFNQQRIKIQPKFSKKRLGTGKNELNKYKNAQLIKVSSKSKHLN